MSFASLIKSFPQMLSQPTGIAVMASVGIHGLLGVTLPYLPLASQEKPGSPRTVQLVELTPAELSRLPQAAPPLTSLPVPNSSQSYQSLPTLPSSLSSPGSSSLSRGSLSRSSLAQGSLSRGSLAQGSLSRGSLQRGSLQRGSTSDLFGGKTRISDPPVRMELANRPRRNPRAADLFSVVRGVKPGDLREFSNRDIEQLDRANQRTEQLDRANQRTEQLDRAIQRTEQLDRPIQSAEQLDMVNRRIEQVARANQNTEQLDRANQSTEQSDSNNQRTEQLDRANQRTEQSDSNNQRTEQLDRANQRTAQSDSNNQRTEQSDSNNQRTAQSDSNNQRTAQSDSNNQRTAQSDSNNQRTAQREERGQQLAYNPNGTSESDAIEKIKDTANQYENAQWQRLSQSINYPPGMACPPQAPNSASITVVVESGNRIVSGPDLAQSTGYDVLNQKALEAVRGAIPATNQRTVYNFRVNVNKDSCTPNSGGTSEG